MITIIAAESIILVPIRLLCLRSMSNYMYAAAVVPILCVLNLNCVFEMHGRYLSV